MITVAPTLDIAHSSWWEAPSLRFASSLLVCLAALSCSRDLSLPAPPGPPGDGAVYGRVVASVPGRTEQTPAGGATVALLGSSLSATANADGNFRLDGVDQTTGSLLFQYTVNSVLRQRLIDLMDIGAGPGRQIALGDVLVVDNASLHGIALLADVTGPSGHGGTVVFVPQGPFTTYTGDDGTYVLDNLPEGHIGLALFHTGYSSVTRDSLQLSSGEDFPVQEITLQPAPPSQPGSISGVVRFNPTTADVSSTTVTATPVGGTPTSGTVNADGGFSASNLAAGVYDLTLAHDGYTPATVNNVLVNSGADTQVSDVLLTQGAAFDAGMRPPVPDAGPPPTPDAGTCSTSAQCTLTQWCDPLFGVCRPQCTAPLDCSDGRVCDVPTGTCVTPCSPGCPAGQTCESATQICRTLCDVSTPCVSGQQCNAQNICVPECTVTADCAGPHRTCQGGACVNDGTCATDVDCPHAQLCTAGTCTPRSAPSADGGFLCANPCSCRLDESCEDGVCAPSVVPTRYLASDGGGLGLSPTSPSGDLLGLMTPGAVLALRSGDTFALAAELDVDAGITLAGGFVDCGPARWVRNSTARTTVTGPTGTVIRVVGTAQAPVGAVALQNLSVVDAVADSCESLIEAAYAPGLALAHVSGGLLFQRTGCGGPYPLMGVFECDHCDNVAVNDLVLNGAVRTGSSAYVGVAHVTNSSGVLANVSQTGVAADSISVGVSASSLSGPLDIRGGTLGPPEGSGGGGGVFITSCGAFPVTVENMQIMVPSASAQFDGIDIETCPSASLIGNSILAVSTPRPGASPSMASTSSTARG